MADSYEVTAVRKITDVDPETDELIDYVEVHAKSKPHGVAISVRVPDKPGAEGDAISAIAAEAAKVEAIFNS